MAAVPTEANAAVYDAAGFFTAEYAYYIFPRIWSVHPDPDEAGFYALLACGVYYVFHHACRRAVGHEHVFGVLRAVLLDEPAVAAAEYMLKFRLYFWYRYWM